VRTECKKCWYNQLGKCIRYSDAQPLEYAYSELCFGNDFKPKRKEPHMICPVCGVTVFCPQCEDREDTPKEKGDRMARTTHCKICGKEVHVDTRSDLIRNLE